MIKHAASLCLIATLLAGGVMLGYRQGLVAATQNGKRSEQPMTPPVATADSAPTAVALMQSAAAPPCILDSTPQIALFGVADVATEHLVITERQSLRPDGGKFNFNIGYQF